VNVASFSAMDTLSRLDRLAMPDCSSRSNVVRTLFVAAVIGTPRIFAAQTPAHQHDMAAMAAITIPKGALYTEGDVRFMQGMIAHHAQAIYMSRMAAAHVANPRVVKLATKIDQSQIAEIRLMQDWLRRNGQAAPDTSSWRTMQMPGMLTREQMALLDAAKGAEFDRLFLTLMIQHHNGALKMVDDLFANSLNAQDVDVSVFANDVQTVQTAEIAIMQGMLDGT